MTAGDHNSSIELVRVGSENESWHISLVAFFHFFALVAFILLVDFENFFVRLFSEHLPTPIDSIDLVHLFVAQNTLQPRCFHMLWGLDSGRWVHAAICWGWPLALDQPCSGHNNFAYTWLFCKNHLLLFCLSNQFTNQCLCLRCAVSVNVLSPLLSLLVRYLLFSSTPLEWTSAALNLLISQPTWIVAPHALFTGSPLHRALSDLPFSRVRDVKCILCIRKPNVWCLRGTHFSPLRQFAKCSFGALARSGASSRGFTPLEVCRKWSLHSSRLH